jgi:hypothetical protein
VLDFSSKHWTEIIARRFPSKAEKGIEGTTTALLLLNRRAKHFQDGMKTPQKDAHDPTI